MDPLIDIINTSAQNPNSALNPQFALLNYFVPGFSVFSSALHTYLGIDLNFYLPLILTIFGLHWLWGYVSYQLWALVGEYLMSSFRVRTDDEIYNMLMLWISRQNFAQNSRNFLVNTDIYSRSNYVYAPDDADSDDDDEEEEGRVVDDSGVISGKQNLHFTPSFGIHRFWYKGWPLIFERIQNQQQINFQSASEREELSISCFGRNPQILKDILQEARQMYLKKDERKTLIFRGTPNSYSDPYWQRTMARPNRPFSTVVLDEKLKKSLIDDISDYIHPATRRWYSNRGIPYRRGYLLHGPPGTGKSSLSLALAGYFRMKIYIVSLSSLTATEEGLTALFSSLPNKCLVLLEDIDTAGLTHTRDQPDPTPQSTSTPVPLGHVPANNSSGTRLSLSGLLNILDGVASKEGRILIMTTNHVDKLDKALIRPGRVDLIIPFQLADRDMTESIFRALYAPHESELASEKGQTKRSNEQESENVDKDAFAKEHAAIMERVVELSVQFAARIPELEFSPAEIQGLLLRHKRSPEEAIEAADEWVAKTRKEKKEKEFEEAEKRRKELEEAEKKEKERKEKEEKEKIEKEEKEKKEKEEKEEKEKKEKEEREKGEKAKEEEKKKGQEKENEKESDSKSEAVEMVKEEDKSKLDNQADNQLVTSKGAEEKKNGASDSEYERI